ncbi:MAG: DUF5667 domain-containing protein [Chloroflexota bacterium]|nr:DUF5667 domain-containing protein [Chloroflexota bacterium]
MSTPELERILDECIDRMARGDTVAQCLMRYPEHEGMLRPLLEAVAIAHQSSNIQPRPGFKAIAQKQFISNIQYERKRKESRSLPIYIWHPRWATAIVAVLVLLVVGSGVVAISSSSMPGDALYPVKTASEDVQLTLTFSNMEKAELHTKFAERRSEEMAYVASEKGDMGEVEEVSSRLSSHLGAVKDSVQAERENSNVQQRVSEIRETLETQADRHRETLQGILERMPEENTTRFNRIYENSTNDYDQAIIMTGGVVDTSQNEPGVNPQEDESHWLTNNIFSSHNINSGNLP